MQDFQPSLSLAVIAKNEEATIARCLGSLHGLAGETVLVDTGSTDSTKDIAASAGARIVDHAWSGDFSAARNEALRHVRGRMVLFLDADEWIEPASLAELGEKAHGEADAAHYVVQVNKYPDGATVRNNVVRLFPNLPGIGFIHRIHEDVIPSLLKLGVPVRNSSIQVGHSGYEDRETVSRKSARNRSILGQAVAAGLDAETEPHARHNLGVALFGEGDFAGALAQFEWCLENRGPASPVGRICRLHAAECHFKMGDFPNALSRLPEKLEPGGHPKAFLLKGLVLEKTDPVSARPWLEAALACPEAPYSPPAHLPNIHLAALAALGKIFSSTGQFAMAARTLALLQNAKAQRDRNTTGIWQAYRSMLAEARS